MTPSIPKSFSTWLVLVTCMPPRDPNGDDDEDEEDDEDEQDAEPAVVREPVVDE